MVPQWIIEKKRDGGALTPAEIREFIEGFTAGRIPDYQMAALAMAIFFRGLDEPETLALTEALLRSGDTVDTSSLPLPAADKHSTGGIGDKISLILAPLVACCGVAVPMISGRGLGITGGTLDKLESIPGYRTQLGPAEFLEVVQRCGCAIIGQTDRLAPADRKLYALRDVTGTVPSIPLIVASILGKKLAEGIQALVLDVKCGSGAFMPTEDRARALAAALLSVARAMGKKAAALVTDMHQPLGRAAGNALEVREAVAVLRGAGPDDVVALTLALGAEMLVLSNVESNAAGARTRLQAALSSGRAFERFQTMVRAQGGAAEALDNPQRLPRACEEAVIAAPREGYVARADAGAIGRACLLLGAGRTKTTDAIDPGAGVSDLVKIGDKVARGQPLARLHAATRPRIEAALDTARSAFQLVAAPVTPPHLILEVL